MTYTALHDPALTYFSKLMWYKKCYNIFFISFIIFFCFRIYVHLFLTCISEFLILFMYCFLTLLNCLCCILQLADLLKKLIWIICQAISLRAITKNVSCFFGHAPCGLALMSALNCCQGQQRLRWSSVVKVVGVHSGSEGGHGPFALLYLHRGSHSQGDLFSAKVCWPGNGVMQVQYFLHLPMWPSWASVLHWVLELLKYSGAFPELFAFINDGWLVFFFCWGEERVLGPASLPSCWCA